MPFSPVLIFHICAALITWPVGMAALFFRKGSHLHRVTGNVFFVSMLSMSGSGAYIAFMKGQLLNIIVGILTFYLVATAWVTVKRRAGNTGFFEVGAPFVALADGVGCLIFAWRASNSVTGLKDGAPAAAYLAFGSVALLAAALDVRMLVGGGVSGAHRIARHLWRMCIALLIDTLSVFIGKQQHFPTAIRNTHLLVVPVILVAVLTIYWLVRTLFPRSNKGKAKGRTRDAYSLQT